MSELMLEKHRAIQEAFSTVGANVGLGGGRSRPLAEALLTLWHFKGLAGVVSFALRSARVGIPSEGEPWWPELRRLGRRVWAMPVRIPVGVFPDVHPLVLHEDTLVVEALAADQTLVGFGSGWGGQQGRVPAPQHSVPLSSAGGRLAPLVDCPVLLQLVRLQEGLAAVGAHEEVLVHVRAHVRDEVGALAEALAALRALVGLLASVRAAVLDEV